MTFQRTDIRIPVAGAELAAWLYRPSAPGPHPVVVMSHGFSCGKEQYVARFAERFALPVLPGIAARDQALRAHSSKPMGDLTGALNFSRP